jgi:hypothetical protein
MAEEMKVPFLGAIPLEPGVALSGDGGEPFREGTVSAETARAFGAILAKIMDEEPAADKTARVGN